MDAADRGDAAFQRIVQRGLEADRARLRHAIGDGDVAQMHQLHHPAHHLHRAGRAGHDAGAQAGDVEAGEIRVVHLGDEHGGHAVEAGATLGGDGLQRGQRIEALAGEDHGGAMGQAAQDAHHHAEAVIERHGDAEPVMFGQPHRFGDEIAVIEDVVVGQRRALRRARGAGGELDVHRRVELQAGADCAQGLQRGRRAQWRPHRRRRAHREWWRRRSG